MLIGHQPKEFLLAVEALTVSFDGFKAVNDLSFYVEENEIRVIIGPNGAGKTTVLDLIWGKTKATSGSIQFHGQEHGGLARAVGTDDDADFILLDIEGEIVDRFEAIEGNRQRLDREQEFLGLVAYQHGLSPHSAGAPSAIDLSVQPSSDFILLDANRRAI